MAIMVDDRSKEWKGEAMVWDSFKRNLPDNIVVYNNREVKGREYDFSIHVPGKGIFIVEVKGWLANKIKSVTSTRVTMEGDNDDKLSPKKQARSNVFRVREKIDQKYHKDILVLSMVAFPFITYEEFEEKNLENIAEFEYTLLKEDLENPKKMKAKLETVYREGESAKRDELTQEFVDKIRAERDYDFKEKKRSDPFYSCLRIFTGESVTDKKTEYIIDQYFAGTKQIVFTDSREDAVFIRDQLNEAFKRRNIEPDGFGLKTGYKNGLTRSLNVATFNFNLYYVADLGKYVSENKTIVDGYTDDDKLLENISKITGFNYGQYKVEHADPEKNILVEAGAGTGKTFSMVTRVAYLCNKEKNPIESFSEEIAMVTFTNDAANEMKTRIKEMFSNYYILTGDTRYIDFIEEVNNAHISTIHRFIIDILRNYPFYTGLGFEFEITTDKNLREKIYNRYFNKLITELNEENENFISQMPVPLYELKNNLMEFSNSLFQKGIDIRNIDISCFDCNESNVIPEFKQFIKNVVLPAEMEYEKKIRERNSIDLNSIIITMNRIIKEYDIKIPFNTRYLFIDEFQDTDDIQIELFREFQKRTNSECRLFIVGDLKQSIYRFRGATLSAFEKIKSESIFEWENYALNVNYRTDKNLLMEYDSIFRELGVSGCLPYEEKDRLTGILGIENAETPMLIPVKCDNKNFFNVLCDVISEEAESISTQMMKKDMSSKERTIAILVRKNWQVEKLVKELRTKGLNVSINSGGDLYKLESTMDLFRLIQAIENPLSPVHLANLIESNYVDIKCDYTEFGDKNEDEITEILISFLDDYFTSVIGITWKDIVNRVYTEPALFVLKGLYDGLEPWKNYSVHTGAQLFYRENYELLVEKIVRFLEVDSVTIHQVYKYLEIKIITGQKEKERTYESETDDIDIVCTTIHKSKGLEYGTVILPYTSEKLDRQPGKFVDVNYYDSKLAYKIKFKNKIVLQNLNYLESQESRNRISEETRILYVAMTRAINKCIWMDNKTQNKDISWAMMLGDEYVD